MNKNKTNEILALCDKLNLTLIDYSSNSITNEHDYDLENNTVFEYQGQQHYYPVDFSGKGQCFAELEFNINVIRDNIKREYCKTNNIKMIEIPYWEYDNMETFLRRKLN